MSTRQHASTHIQTTNHIFFTTVNTRFACQYAATNNVFLDSVQNFTQFVFVQGFIFSKQRRDGFRFDDINLRITLLFVGDAESIAQTSFSQCSNARVQRFVYRLRLPVPTRFTGFFHQFIDVLNDNLLLFMTEHYCAQHLVFAQQFSFRFNHQYSGFSTGNNQIQFALFQLVLSRVQYVLVIDVTYAGSTNRTIERNTRQRQCCGSANHRDDIRVNLRVNRNHGGDNLNFVDEAFREQRANRAVNQTRDQGFAFAWTTFTTEEATRDTTSSVGTLLIVNGQWEEVLTWFGFFLANNGNEYRGVIHANHNSGSSLTSHHAGFQSHGVLAVLEFTNDRIKQCNILSLS